MTTETKILTKEQRVSIEAECHMRYAQHKSSLVGTAIELTEQDILQSPEIQAMRRDAGRYRWLRNAETETDAVVTCMYEICLEGDDLDLAIDAAMEKEE